MCTILFSFCQREEEPLILLANRDEFYDRPSRPAERWTDDPGILAGRDLVGKGTWLGVTDSGRIAAVTNYRDPEQERGSRSRGALVADFLRSDDPPEEYLERVRAEAAEYTGFNLLAGIFSENAPELFYFSNRGGSILRLGPGLYGLSNHLLDTPWPKTVRGKDLLRSTMNGSGDRKEAYFDLLSDRTLADDELLPDTGVGYEKEKLLSAIFIETPVYGTRCSTVVVFRNDGSFDFEERVFV